jgi:hypothetical protein
LRKKEKALERKKIEKERETDREKKIDKEIVKD